MAHSPVQPGLPGMQVRSGRPHGGLRGPAAARGRGKGGLPRAPGAVARRNRREPSALAERGLRGALSIFGPRGGGGRGVFPPLGVLILTRRPAVRREQGPAVDLQRAAVPIRRVSAAGPRLEPAAGAGGCRPRRCDLQAVR